MKKTKHTVALALAAMLACQPLSVYAAGVPTAFCLCGNLCRYESGSLGGCRSIHQ